MHLGLIGFGAIGRELLRLLEDNPVETLTVLVRPARLEVVRAALAEHRSARQVNVLTEASGLAGAAPDLVVEAAGQRAVAAHLPVLLEAGLTVVVASVGALADDALYARLERASEAGRGRLILPAGAIGGVDLLAAVSAAGDLSVEYTGTKPPGAWLGTPAQDAVDLENLDEATEFFSGTARDAALSYPKNANVAATLALSGPGLDATRVRLVADPAAPGNLHAYTAISPLCRFTVSIEGSPSPGNARTSLSTVYSLLREVRRVRDRIVI